MNLLWICSLKNKMMDLTDIYIYSEEEGGPGPAPPGPLGRPHHHRQPAGKLSSPCTRWNFAQYSDEAPALTGSRHTEWGAEPSLVLTADTVQAKGTDAAPSGWSWRDPDQRRPAPAFQPRHCEHQQGCRVVCVNNGATSCWHVELSKEAAWEDVTLQMMYISPNF